MLVTRDVSQALMSWLNVVLFSKSELKSVIADIFHEDTVPYFVIACLYVLVVDSVETIVIASISCCLEMNGYGRGCKDILLNLDLFLLGGNDGNILNTFFLIPLIPAVGT